VADWLDRLNARYGGTPVVEDETEELSEDVLDHLATAAAEVPAAVTRVRIEAPCVPCAKKAAREAAERERRGATVH
jgi:hypothetical protein